MNLTQEEKDKAFREWKEGIDKRCAEHVEKHPEHKPPTKPAGFTPEIVRALKNQLLGKNMLPPGKPLFEYETFGVDSAKEEKPNLRVEVRESAFNIGNWIVLVDGDIKESFAGPLAHLNATKFAADILNGESKGNDRGISSGVPTRCLQCGSYYVHRKGCPAGPGDL